MVLELQGGCLGDKERLDNKQRMAHSARQERERPSAMATAECIYLLLSCRGMRMTGKRAGWEIAGSLMVSLVRVLGLRLKCNPRQANGSWPMPLKKDRSPRSSDSTNRSLL